jgi:hypothetical protein
MAVKSAAEPSRRAPKSFSLRPLRRFSAPSAAKGFSSRSLRIFFANFAVKGFFRKLDTTPKELPRP